ncbi:succinate dehydrogenase/fumarate reductase iron-sulfur subunit [Hydrogenobacter thermophilus]|uniref:succinate dehydrogenase/fumarate reductase iron-sulfur subunit n=1 Tax=Hydrogenobacter thermophilus TaxID=940 RepID=UPI0030F842AE
MILRLSIRREDPESGICNYQDFEIPYEDGMTFLTALQRIKEYQDETLTFRHFCRAGICGTCTIYINGFPKLACKEQVLPYVLLEKRVVIEPLRGFKVIKDLAVDNDKIIKKLKEIHGWVKTGSDDCRIPSDLSRKLESAADCILCLACQSYCPQVLEENYAGPLIFAKLYRFLEDPRDKDKEERFVQAVEKGNLYHCLSCNKCNHVCPKEVEPATLIRRLMVYSR